jgi:nucleoside-diphosphate-sugar epimerase
LSLVTTQRNQAKLQVKATTPTNAVKSPADGKLWGSSCHDENKAPVEIMALWTFILIRQTRYVASSKETWTAAMGDASLLQVSNALIFGGNGKTARHLTTILRNLENPFTVYSVIRNPDQIPGLEAIGAKPIVQDIVTATEGDFIDIIERTRPRVVVWAAGGKDAQSAEAVDRDGAIRAITALSKAAIPMKRYIVISALDVRDHENKPVPDWYTPADIALSNRMYGAIGPIMRAKLAADTELRVGNATRKLHYTIVRPGGLIEAPGVGRIRAGKVGVIGMISRQDVARVINAAIHNSGTFGLAFDILGPIGDSSTVEEAVDKVAENREDTFEGYY